MTIVKVVASGAVLLYGSVTLVVAFVYTLLQRETWLGRTAADKELLKSGSFLSFILHRTMLTR